MLDEALKEPDVAEAAEDAAFVIEVICPHCKSSLMDESVKIDGRRAVRLEVAHNGKRGWLGLSSVYGSCSILSEHQIPADTVARFFCPHCREELIDSWRCPDCAAPMIAIGLRWGGAVRVCSRRGCTSHMLDLV